MAGNVGMGMFPSWPMRNALWPGFVEADATHPGPGVPDEAHVVNPVVIEELKPAVSPGVTTLDSLLRRL